jgi:hypothetical protein
LQRKEEEEEEEEELIRRFSKERLSKGEKDMVTFKIDLNNHN